MSERIQKQLARKSPRIRNVELIKECLHLDLPRIQRTGLIVLPLQSYLWIFFYFLHNLRFLSLINASSTIRAYLGDHYQFWPEPVTIWYVLLIATALCIISGQGSLLIAIRNKRRAASHLSNILLQLHSSDDASQLDITSEDFKNFSRRLRLGPSFINLSTINAGFAMTALICYSLGKSKNFSALSVWWAIVSVHYAAHFWRTAGCYLFNLDLVCILINMRLRKIMSTMDEDFKDANIVRRFLDIHLINLVVNKQILVYLVGFVPIVALIFTPAMWSGHWLTKVVMVLGFTTSASFLAYIVHRTATIQKTVQRLFVRLSVIAPRRGISLRDKLGLWKLMKQFRKGKYFGLTCGGLFVMDKLVFVKVFLAMARVSILAHKLKAV